ncbi:MAG: hypothetical protein ACLR7Z_05750 [Bilophila wadsworthia]
MLGAVEGPTVRLTGPSVPAALPLLVPGTAPQHELLTWIPIAGDKFGLFEAEALVQARGAAPSGSSSRYVVTKIS